MGMTEIRKCWAMPNNRTFLIKPIKEFVEQAIQGKSVVIDPFANLSKYGTITNDLNTEYDTTYHLDALEFLKMLPPLSADAVLFDPPYSITQAAEHYKKYGTDKLEVNVANMGYWASCKDNIARVLKVGGG